MKLLYIENALQNWQDILVIGKTIERDNGKYHIIGMTMTDEAKLYIIGPYHEPEIDSNRKKGVCSQRKILKEHTGVGTGDDSYLHCSDFYLGNQRLQVRSASSGPLKYSTENYEEIQMFFDMLRAGWIIPEWLKNEEWDHLQLVTFSIRDMKKLPEYSLGMPITIKHSSCFVSHILEKTVTLNVGKSRSFRFVDHCGDEVWFYINNVTLVDMWKDAEEQFSDPGYAKHFSEEQIQELKNDHYKMLEQSCPKGMYYVGIEYECTKDISPQFYTKEYLKSNPMEQKGNTIYISGGRLVPDRETGTHNLPLKGCVIPAAVSSDTAKIPAELFLYLETASAWEEKV